MNSLNNESIELGRWITEKEERVQDGTQHDEEEANDCRSDRED